MAVSTVRRIVSLSALMLAMSVAAKVDAASMYNVTDLGSGYSFTKDGNGYTTAVTNGDGSQTYAFSKYPVSYNYPPVNFVYDPSQGQYEYESIGANGKLSESLLAASNKYGSLSFQATNGIPAYEVASLYYFQGSSPNTTYEWTVPGYGSPAHDFNTSGQVVGQDGPSATITGPNFKGISGVYSYLDADIAQNLGIRLTSALYIDDLGDIIAEGTLNGKDQYFLLTPNGAPTPAPEPSTIAFLLVGFTALGIRSVRQRSSAKADRSGDRLKEV